MTREEQINLYLKERNIPITSLEANSIIEGIKWADEHPNLYNDEKYHTVKVSCLDELNRKAKLYDEFLEKTCEWMRKQKCQEYSGGPLERIIRIILSIERIIPDFVIAQYKKEMEG